MLIYHQRLLVSAITWALTIPGMWILIVQLMKKEVIVQGMGWGHMPDFLVENELRSGSLFSITGKHFRGGQVGLVAARRRNIPRGPVAEWLWRYVEEQSPSAVTKP